MGFGQYLRNKNRKEEKIKVAVLGLDGSGKSSIISSLCSSKARVAQTFGFNVSVHRHSGREIEFWDVGGQEKTRRSWKIYCQDANVILFVIDSCDSRIETLKEELSKVVNDYSGSAVFLFLVNKIDACTEETRNAIAREIVCGIGKNVIYGIAFTSAVALSGLNEVPDKIVELAVKGL